MNRMMTSEEFSADFARILRKYHADLPCGAVSIDWIGVMKKAWKAMQFWRD